MRLFFGTTDGDTSLCWWRNGPALGGWFVPVLLMAAWLGVPLKEFLLKCVISWGSHSCTLKCEGSFKRLSARLPCSVLSSKLGHGKSESLSKNQTRQVVLERLIFRRCSVITTISIFTVDSKAWFPKGCCCHRVPLSILRIPHDLQRRREPCIRCVPAIPLGWGSLHAAALQPCCLPQMLLPW